MALTGCKKNSVGPVMDVPDLKRIAKHYNKATINDVVLSLLSTCLLEYMHNHGDKTTKSVNVLMAFSFRELPQSYSEHKFENDVSGLQFTLPLHTKFADAVSAVNKETS